MGHVNLYMDDESIKLLEKAAKREGTSVSKWVQKQIAPALRGGWPEGYWQRVWGSLKDVEIERPPQGDFKDDVRKARL
ncbi:MAG: toxin-antitoxin system, antitoxin component [Phycisphaerae bacterium]